MDRRGAPRDRVRRRRRALRERSEGLPRRRRGARRAARPAGQGPRLRRGRRHARRDGAPGLQAGRQGLPGVPASRRRTRSTRSRAPSARAAAATRASRSTPRPTSRSKRTCKRRDLTINAMAKAEDGTLIDPFRRQEGPARTASCATSAKPSPRTRCASCASRASLRASASGIADETMQLMKHMVDSGEADYLVPERVWQEFAQGPGRAAARS